MQVLHIGPYLKTKGGITTVLKNYSEHGIEDVAVEILETHADGSKLYKLWIMIVAFCKMYYAVKNNQVLQVHVGDFPSLFRKAFITLLHLNSYSSKIIHIHGAEFEKQYCKLSDLKKKVVKWYLNQFDAIICLSGTWKEIIDKISHHPNIVIIENSVPHQIQKEYPESNKLRICFLGLIGERKGVFDLIKAVKIMKDKGYDVLLSIGGNGDTETLNELTTSLDLSNVNYVGWISGSDKRMLLHQSDVFVLPSYAEGMPMSILEAMSVGLPIISTTVGGVPDIVHNRKNGLLIDPGDYIRLADKLMLLHDDRQLIKEMGDCSYEMHMEKYSYGSHSNKINQLYKMLELSDVK